MQRAPEKWMPHQQGDCQYRYLQGMPRAQGCQKRQRSGYPTSKVIAKTASCKGCQERRDARICRDAKSAREVDAYPERALPAR